MVPPMCDIYSAPLNPTAPSPQVAPAGWFGRPARPPNGPARSRLTDPAHPPWPAVPVCSGVVGHVSPGHVPIGRSDMGQQSCVPLEPARTSGEETKSTALLRPPDDGDVRRWCHAYRT